MRACLPHADPRSVLLESESPLPIGRQAGRAAFTAVLKAAWRQAALLGWHEWWWCDPDFTDWPLADQETVDVLSTWAAPGRRLVLLGGRFGDLERCHPRFVRWRKTWDHLIEVRACSGARSVALPSAIWTPQWCCRRLDRSRAVFTCDDSAAALTSLRAELDEHWRRAVPAFPATVLGL